LRHMGKISTSKAQQRILDVLADGKEHTTYQLCLEAEVTNPAGWLSELKAQGFHFIKRCLGKSERGARVYGYTWARRATA
jgi:hypothetical protein